MHVSTEDVTTPRVPLYVESTTTHTTTCYATEDVYQLLHTTTLLRVCVYSVYHTLRGCIQRAGDGWYHECMDTRIPGRSTWIVSCAGVCTRASCRVCSTIRVPLLQRVLHAGVYTITLPHHYCVQGCMQLCIQQDVGRMDVSTHATPDNTPSYLLMGGYGWMYTWYHGVRVSTCSIICTTLQGVCRDVYIR